MSHTVGTKGQVVIPKALRDALKIQSGQEVVFERQGDSVVMSKASTTTSSAPLHSRFAGTELTAALLEARTEERRAEESATR